MRLCAMRRAIKQVCVEPRTSALNRTLPAPRASAAIDRYLLHEPELSSKPTAAVQDRQDRTGTDTRPLQTPRPALHTMPEMSIRMWTYSGRARLIKSVGTR